MMAVEEACNALLGDLGGSRLQQWEGVFGGCDMTHLYHGYDEDYHPTSSVQMCRVLPW